MLKVYLKLLTELLIETSKLEEPTDKPLSEAEYEKMVLIKDCVQSQLKI